MADRRDWAVKESLATFYGDVALYAVVDKDGVYMAFCGASRAQAESIARNHNESARRAG